MKISISTCLILNFIFLLWFCVAPSTFGENLEEHRNHSVENLINVSWGDQIMIARGDAQLDTPDRVKRSVKSWLDNYDGKTVLWRMSAISMKRFFERRQSGDFTKTYLKKVEKVEKIFSPATVARKEARKNGQNFLLYMTIFDHGAPLTDLYGGNTPFPFQDRYVIEHPDIQAVDLEGNYHNGVLEMAHPEARKLMINRIVSFVEEFDSDGVYICSRTHSLPALHADQFGFGKPIVDEYQQRYGVNILQDSRFNYKSRDYRSNDPAVEKWRRLRGEYLVQFYRELREALPNKIIYTGIPRGRYLGPPYGNLYLDWETLVQESLVDGLVLGAYSGKQLHPPLYKPHNQIGYQSSEDDSLNIPSVEEAMEEVYGPLCQQYNVKLFYNSAAYGSLEKKRLKNLEALNGFMLVTPASVPGRGAITFDGPMLRKNREMTIEAFIYVNKMPDSHQGTPRILSKYSHYEGDLHRGWEWIVDADGRFRYRVNLANDQLGMQGDQVVKSQEPLQLRRWIHVATVFDMPQREIRLYLDGKLDQTQRIAACPIRVTAEQDLHLGRYGGSDSNQFDGMIDELRIVERALKFKRVPTRPYRGDEPGTVCLYHFDKIGPTFNVTNAADPQQFPIKVIGGGDSLLVDSVSGFGRAFDMGTEEK
ncbi:LamG-like jellyroll fold domain-containing protein [Poriferisphaera sp. WC338]|uniref:LamG domain-containing protein n=1 Tax=Poriferisphaera sp. WC338 TaxID=3425129 RepID=UPI003D81B089